MRNWTGCILVALTVLLSACSSWADTDAFETIKDEPKDGPLTSWAITRASADDETFAVGSTLRLFLSDSSSAWFTLTDSGWQDTSLTLWDESSDSLTVVALSPALSAYETSSLYSASTGRLRDVLFAVQRAATGQELSLHFRHLFSRLTVNISDALQSEVAQLSLTVPMQVTVLTPSLLTSSSPAEAITCSTDSVISTLVGNDADSYSFCVPSGQRMQLSLSLTLNNGECYSYTLNDCAFVAGGEYTCLINKAEEAVGIHSTAEFLEFASWYNSSYSKAVEKYGVDEDGRTVFRLLNDLDFEGADLSSFKSTGQSGTMFADEFDGMGHTLRNFAPTVAVQGIFYGIAAKGYVHDLHLENCQFTADASMSNGVGHGILAGNVYGTVNNCSVRNSTFTDTDKKFPLGILVGRILNGGSVVNGLAEGCTLTGGLYAGFIGDLYDGGALNCLVRRNTFNGGSYVGTFCGRAGYKASSHRSYLRNCWMSPQSIAGTTAGYLIGDANYAGLISCYYPSTPNKLYGVEGTVGTSNFLPYDRTSFQVITGSDAATTSVVDKLNQWIVKNGTTYPDTPLNTWVLDTEAATLTFE